jgi:hypothetical protein
VDLTASFSGCGKTIKLHSGDALVVHRSQDSRVLILEYEVHGKILSNGASYDNRLISVITIENRKIGIVLARAGDHAAGKSELVSRVAMDPIWRGEPTEVPPVALTKDEVIGGTLVSNCYLAEADEVVDVVAFDMH